MSTKKRIKKWLGIDEIEDTLIDPHSEKQSLGSEIDIRLEKKDFESFKESFNSTYQECYSCGCLVNIHKTNPLPVLKKDIIEPNVLSEDNLYLAMAYFAGNSINEETKSKTIYFCKHCKAEYPKKK